MADKALVGGSSDEMIKKLNAHMPKAILEKFDKALSTRRERLNSVDAGREYVEAYVTYVSYIVEIHDAILSTAGHQHSGAAESTPHRSTKHAEHK